MIYQHRAVITVYRGTVEFVSKCDKRRAVFDVSRHHLLSVIVHPWGMENSAGKYRQYRPIRKLPIINSQKKSICNTKSLFRMHQKAPIYIKNFLWRGKNPPMNLPSVGKGTLLPRPIPLAAEGSCSSLPPLKLWLRLCHI